MIPISLLTKGYISSAGEEVNNYYYPFAITIDYGEKVINIEVEDNELLVLIEQPVLTIQAGQENIEVIIDQPEITVKD